MIEQTVHIPTYHNDGRGHDEPSLPVKISIHQGIGLSLPPAQPSGDEPDIYLERREDHWTLNVSPDSADIRAIVKIHDDGRLEVTDAQGMTVLAEEAPERT